MPFEILIHFDFLFAFFNMVLVVHYLLPYSAPIVIPKQDFIYAKGDKMTVHQSFTIIDTGLVGKENLVFVF